MATKSIGSAGGRDYSTLAAWASYVNALALSAPEVGECYNDSEFTTSTQIAIGGWTGGSSTNTVTLQCHAGQSFRDNASVQTNALRYNQSNGVGLSSTLSYDWSIKLTTAFTIVDGLQVKTTGNSNGSIWSNTDNQTVQNCILQGSLQNSSSFMLRMETGSSSVGQNCAVLVTSANGGGVICRSGSFAREMTIVNSAGGSHTGFQLSYSSPIIQNVAVYGFTTDYTGTASASSSNNATDKGSFGGTNFGGSGQTSITSSEWQNLTAGSEDLRLASGSTKLKDNGATAGPSTDIAGTSRPQGSAYDIGAWELVVSGGTTNISLSVTETSSPAITLLVQRTMAMTETGTPVLTFLKVFQILLTLTETSVAGILQLISRRPTASETSSASIAKSQSTGLSVICISTPSDTTLTQRTLGVTVTSTPVLTFLKVLTILLSVTETSLATMTRVVLLVPSVTETSTATVVRLITKTLAMTASSVASLSFIIIPAGGVVTAAKSTLVGLIRGVGKIGRGF